jgi:hypothetical protein
MLVVGATAYRIAQARAHPLPLVVQGDPKAVDPAGRIWSIACGALLVARSAPVDLAARGCVLDE